MMEKYNKFLGVKLIDIFEYIEELERDKEYYKSQMEKAIHESVEYQVRLERYEGVKSL